jgi:hypothetical protein
VLDQTMIDSDGDVFERKVKETGQTVQNVSVSILIIVVFDKKISAHSREEERPLACLLTFK